MFKVLFLAMALMAASAAHADEVELGGFDLDYSDDADGYDFSELEGFWDYGPAEEFDYPADE